MHQTYENNFIIYITTTIILEPLVNDYLGEPVPKKNIHPITPILIINHPVA